MSKVLQFEGFSLDKVYDKESIVDLQKRVTNRPSNLVAAKRRTYTRAQSKPEMMYNQKYDAQRQIKIDYKSPTQVAKQAQPNPYTPKTKPEYTKYSTPNVYRKPIEKKVSVGVEYKISQASVRRAKSEVINLQSPVPISKKWIVNKGVPLEPTPSRMMGFKKAAKSEILQKNAITSDIVQKKIQTLESAKSKIKAKIVILLSKIKQMDNKLAKLAGKDKDIYYNSGIEHVVQIIKLYSKLMKTSMAITVLKNADAVNDPKIRAELIALSLTIEQMPLSINVAKKGVMDKLISKRNIYRPNYPVSLSSVATVNTNDILDNEVVPGGFLETIKRHIAQISRSLNDNVVNLTENSKQEAINNNEMTVAQKIKQAISNAYSDVKSDVPELRQDVEQIYNEGKAVVEGKANIEDVQTPSWLKPTLAVGSAILVIKFLL